MGKLQQSINQNTQSLEKMLPERPTLEILEHWSDSALMIGLRRMGEILKEDSYTTIDGKEIQIMPVDKIKSFNALVNLGRLIEIRRARAAKDEDKALEIPEEYLIKNG